MNGTNWLVFLATIAVLAAALGWRRLRRKAARPSKHAARPAPQMDGPAIGGGTAGGQPMAEPLPPPELSGPEVAGPPRPDSVSSVLLWEVFLARQHALAVTCRLKLESLEDKVGGAQERRLAQQQVRISGERMVRLEASYQEELACHEAVIAFLGKLAARDPGSPAAQIRESLLHSAFPGEAEHFLDEWSQDRQHGRTRSAMAAFLSGRLAELRIDLAQALTCYCRALHLAPDDPEYLRTAGNLAHQLGHYDYARRWRAALLRLIRQRPGGCNPLELALAQRDLAYTCLKAGRQDEAGPLYKSAMSVMGTELGNNHPEMATAWFQIGEMQESQGTFEQAYVLYQRSFKMLESTLGLLDPRLCPALEKLATLSLRFGREQDALAYYRKLVTIQEKALSPDHPFLADSLTALAEACISCGEFSLAEQCCRKSLKITEAIHEREHPTIVALLSELSWLCAQQGKLEEASRYQNEAEAIHAALDRDEAPAPAS